MTLTPEDRKFLHGFFMQLTHYDFCADNPEDSARAYKAWQLVEQLAGGPLKDPNIG